MPPSPDRTVLLVERDGELDRLGALARQAADGHGRIAWVEAPMGMGKTSLLAALDERLSADGTRVLRARGTELEREFGYGIARQLFERTLADLDASDRAAALDGAAALAESAIGAPAAGAPADAFAISHALFWLAANLTAHGPLALVVDDAHWADEASLRFLAYLGHRITDVPVLLAIAVRQGAEGDALAALTAEPAAAILRPGPLSERGSAELIREVVGDDPDAALVDVCHERTGGNPFFLTEIARACATDVFAAGPDAVERVRGFSPPEIARVVLLRLAGLGEDAVALARAVAVLGGPVDPRLAWRLLDLAEEPATRAADVLERAGVFTVAPALDFAHPILRTVVEEDLGAAGRAHAHARAARLLDEAGASAERVAVHLLASAPAGDPWVVDRLRAAAGQALGSGSPAAAANLLHRALDEGVDDGRASLLTELGMAELTTDPVAATDHLQEGLAGDVDPAMRVRTAVALSQAFMALARGPVAVSVLQDELERVDGSDADARLEVQAAIIGSAVLDGSTRATGERVAGGVPRDIPGATPSERLMLAVLAFEDAKAVVPADRVADIARRAAGGGALLADRGPGAPLVHMPALVLTYCERFDEAAALQDAAADASRSHGSMMGVIGSAAGRAEVELRRGAVTEAEGLARDGLRVAGESGWLIGLPVIVSILADSLLEQGRVDEAEQLLAQHRLDGELPPLPPINGVLATRGRIRMVRGQNAAARGDFLLCGERERLWGARNPAMLAWRSGASLASAALGDVDEATRYATAELDLARVFGTPRATGIALRALGIVTGESGYLADAVATLRDSHARLELARSLVDLGAAHRRGGHRAAARDPLAEGMELAHACGATALVDRAGEELRAAGARPRRVQRTGVDALTASELRVARLAASGLSNPEIAQRLFVTRKTVEHHMSAVLRKLDARSRDELAGRLGAQS